MGFPLLFPTLFISCASGNKDGCSFCSPHPAFRHSLLHILLAHVLCQGQVPKNCSCLPWSRILSGNPESWRLKHMDRKKCPDRLEISHPALVQEPRNVTWGSAVLQGVGGHPILCQHQLGLVFSTGVPFPEEFTDTHSIWLSPNGQCLQLDPWH